MINLVSTSDLVQVITSASVIIHAHASFLDIDSSTTPVTMTPGVKDTITTAAPQTVTVAGSPGSSTVFRDLSFLSIFNTDATTACTITVQHVNGSATVNLFKATLQPGSCATYNEDLGWVVYDASGKRLGSPFSGGEWIPVAAGTPTVTVVAGAWYELDSTSSTQQTLFNLPAAPIDGAPALVKFVGASCPISHAFKAASGDLVELVRDAPGTFSASGGTAQLPTTPGAAFALKYKAASVRWEQWI